MDGMPENEDYLTDEEKRQLIYKAISFLERPGVVLWEKCYENPLAVAMYTSDSTNYLVAMNQWPERDLGYFSF